MYNTFLYQPLSQFEIVLGNSNIYLMSYFSFYSFILDNVNSLETLSLFCAKYLNSYFVYYTLKCSLIHLFKFFIHYFISIIAFTFIFDFSTQLIGPSDNNKDFLSLINFKNTSDFSFQNTAYYQIAYFLLNAKKILLDLKPFEFIKSLIEPYIFKEKTFESIEAEELAQIEKLKGKLNSLDWELSQMYNPTSKPYYDEHYEPSKPLYYRILIIILKILSFVFSFVCFVFALIYDLFTLNCLNLFYIITLLTFLKIFQFLIYFFNSNIFLQYTNNIAFYITNPCYRKNKYISYYFIDYSLTKFHTTIFFILTFFFIFFVLNLKKEFFFRPSINFIIFGLIDKFLTNTIVQQLGIKRGQEFSVVLKTFFFLILFANLFGLIPFSFTITSHLVFTFGLSFAIISTITIFGFYKQGYKFLNLLIPGGAPKALLPILIPIELLSYIVRCFSLAIRLFANMMSGHSLLYILSGFVIQITAAGFFLIALAPFFIVLLIGVLEIGVAMLQAYVFLVLTCIYLRDGYQAGH